MDKLIKKNRRKRSIRKKISGSAERPRMNVFKSNKKIYVQLIDDVEGKTLCGLSSACSAITSELKADTKKNTNFAEALGAEIAKLAQEKGIKKIAFDRGGLKYHGVIKTLAESARKNGLEF